MSVFYRKLNYSSRYNQELNLLKRGARYCKYCDGGLVDTAALPWVENLERCDECNGNGLNLANLHAYTRSTK
jgi:hypothetical protein